ncbi:MAG: hypothetical protein Q4A17_09335 [Thermoguttaceae bacterium]|nr:hypothetical protein [Thermoguttaceae bacterium]MDO4858132.1 hypothetical protein [Thermoguttaceae bacterium]
MSKRFFLLTLFFLCGFLPTLYLLLLGIYRQTEFYVRNYASFAESQLGLPVEITGIVHHTPSQGRIRGLTVFQPGAAADGSHLPLASAPWVDWIQYKTIHEGKEILLTKWVFPELTLDAQCLEPLWRTHQRILTDSPYGKKSFQNSEILLQVEGPVKVGFQENALELQRSELRISQENGVPKTFIHFFVPDSGREAQVQLTLRKIVQNSSQVMQATLATDTQGIPVIYLQSLFPMLQSMGPDCRFIGSIAIQQSFSRWSGVFRGRFSRVDAAFFIPNKVLTGSNGILEITKARFDGSHLIQAEGTFQLENGTISRSFLARLQKETNLMPGNWPAMDTIPFRELGIRFQMNETQMQIFGVCSGPIPGIFLNGTNGPLLRETSTPRNPFSRAVFMESLR